MARPKKYGLDYFPLDVDIFEDDKLFDVQNEYGSTGEAVYLRLLCLVYKNGYYFRFDSLDKLALLILRSIGNRWADKEKIREIILYLGECGLFSAELLRAGVVTSRSIQRRFLKAKERSCPVIGEYCLIPREPVPDEDNPAPVEQAAAQVSPTSVEHAAAQVSPAPVEHAAAAGQVSITPTEQAAAAPDMQAGVIAAETGVIAAETGVIAAETVVNVCNNPTKKSKEKQSKEKESTAQHSEAKQTKEKEITAEQSEAKQIKEKEKAAAEESKEIASADPRTQLVSKYGSRAVEDYERRYRGWQQKNGITGGNMYNVISKWMAQDGVEADNAPHSFDSDEVMSEIMRKYMQQL